MAHIKGLKGGKKQCFSKCISIKKIIINIKINTV